MPHHPDLSHIPGPPVPPVVGHTLTVVRDAYGSQQDFIKRYGDVYKVKVLGKWRVNICGPDALAKVLLDRDKIFSSTGGWDLISRVFSGGLMLQDFNHHRQNRRIMQAAFRAQALQDYMSRLHEMLEQRVAAWPRDTPFDFAAAAKEMTLHTGCGVFMGLSPDSDVSQTINTAFKAEIRAAFALIRAPVPFTPMWHGTRGRAYIRRIFRDLIPERRANPGADFFSQMCIATDEEGKAWSDNEIIDHFNFLMVAAHDTTATTLTSILSALSEHPEWQDKLASEIDTLGQGPLVWTDLAKLEQTEHVIKEALRLVPPVPFIPRRVLKNFEWRGFHIPAGADVSLNPGVTMLSADLFLDPLKFDPDRFSAHRAEDQVHRFAWAPFGGGPHKCIGMHFAMMQVKLFLITLLRNTRVEPVRKTTTKWHRIPIPKPVDGLPIVLRRL
jgi:cytochrome P450